MSDEKLGRLLKRFATAAKLHHEALEALDEHHANAHAAILAGLYEAIIREGEEGREGLMMLVEDKDDIVAGMAAVYTLRYRPDRSVEVLRRLAAQGGLLGFRASVALGRWEAGEWGD